MSQMENMNQERDGLRYPSIDELTDKSSSKYKLVIAAAKRAKEIDASKKSFLAETKKYEKYRYCFRRDYC